MARTLDASIPDSIKEIRACLKCKLIKTTEQFREEGCENCPNFTSVAKYTTPTFYGMITMLDPDRSWVARWQRSERLARGCYAIQTIGALPTVTYDDYD